MRFNAVAVPPVPAAYYDVAWLGWYQVVVQSRRREWWVASHTGPIWPKGEFQVQVVDC